MNCTICNSDDHRWSNCPNDNGPDSFPGTDEDPQYDLKSKIPTPVTDSINAYRGTLTPTETNISNVSSSDTEFKGFKYLRNHLKKAKKDPENRLKWLLVLKHQIDLAVKYSTGKYQIIPNPGWTALFHKESKKLYLNIGQVKVDEVPSAFERIAYVTNEAQTIAQAMRELRDTYKNEIYIENGTWFFDRSRV